MHHHDRELIAEPSMRRKPQTAERHEACGGFSYIDALAAASLSCLFAILVQSTLAPQLRLMKNDHSIIRDNSDAELKMVAEKLRLDIRAAQPPVSTSPQNESAACELAGRRPVLHLVDSLGRPITYSVGDAPAPIWRSPVLMRCARPQHRWRRHQSGADRWSRHAPGSLVRLRCPVQPWRR